MKSAQVIICIFALMITVNLDAVSTVPKILEYNGFIDVFSQTSAITGAFLGCYQDGSPKDLANLVLGWTPNMTVEYCAAICFQNKFKYAGLQNTNICFCDNSYGKYGYIFNCGAKCSGNSNQICGNNNINSVYNVSQIAKAAFSPYIGSGYIGCYKDNWPRDLASLLIDGAKNMTISTCQSSCAKNKFKFAGLQAGQACFCGNSYGKYGLSQACNVQCTGNKLQTCGGWMVNSVYSASP